MKKKWWFLTLLMISLLVLPSATALAQEEDRGRPHWRPFILQGELRGLGESSILVHVQRGNAPARPYIGRLLQVMVDEDTHYYRQTGEGLQEIQFADLAHYLGHQVLVSGRVKTENGQDTFLARRVLVKKPHPVPFTARGEITEINNASEPPSFKLKVLRGTGAARASVSVEIEIFVTEDTEFYRRDPDAGLVPITFDDLEVGNVAQVAGVFAEGRFTARKVVVLPPRPVPFWLLGQIVEIPTPTAADGEQAFTVEVRRGNGAARGKEGEQLVIVTTEDTKFFACEAGECQEIGFDDLAVEDWVNVAGRALEDVFTARVVVKRAPPPAETP